MAGAGRRAYLVGIGGIGMSAIAQWLVADGWNVSGTDVTGSEIVDRLQAAGIHVDIRREPRCPAGTDLLVFTDAVPPDHLLRTVARARGVRVVSYAELLGEQTRSRRTLAIAGSHGKSTTTALAGLLLEAAGHDPWVVVGTRVPSWESGETSARDSARAGVGNFRRGASDIAVVEADEYRGHCLALHPAVSVITTTDYDHVDAFPTVESYRDVYRKFIAQTAPAGLIVLQASDHCTPEFSRRAAGRSLVTFGIATPKDGSPTYAATRPVLRERRQEFEVFRGGKTCGTFTIPLPGEHLVLDALAALAAVSPWDIPLDILQEVLAGFKGTWRRFEHVGVFDGAPVISDYAHHPTELHAVITATKAWYPNRRLLLVFQPHQKARTRAFAGKFLDVLTLRTPDVLILSEVYDVAGREEAGDATSVEPWVVQLRERGTTATFAPTLEAAEHEIREQATPDDMILIAGAGTIDRVARRIVTAHG